MTRIPVSGVNNEALTTPGVDVREVISGLDPDGDGRIFFLEELRVMNEHASQVAHVEIYDADEATAVTATLQRGGVHVPPGATVVMKFAGAGLRFITNCVAAVTNGTINTDGGISGTGYLA